MVKKIGILAFFFILLFSSYVKAADTKVIRISVFIPAIIGLNVPKTASSSEDKIITPDSIIQTEQRKGGQIVLKTVLLK